MIESGRALLRSGLRPVPFWYLGLGVVGALLALAYGYLPPAAPGRVIGFLIIQAALTALALVALLFRRAAPVPLGWVLLVGLAVRGCAVPSDLIYENDVYRYLWDARVSASGTNPYRYAPDDEQLSSLRDDWVFPNIPFRKIPTIYPPLAQGAFLLANRIFGESIEGLQGLMIACELFTLLGVARLGKRLGSARAAATYALHPLAIKEFVQGAHIDALAVALFTWAAVFVLERKRVPAALSMAGAVLVKVFPLALVPLLFRRMRGATLLMLAVVAAAFAAFAWGGVVPIRGLEAFSRYWIYNPSIYDLVSRALALHWPLATALTWARPLCAVALAGTLMAIAIRTDPQGEASYLRACLASVMALLLLSPAANPWYVGWTVPLALATRWAPAVVWTFTATLAYAFYLSGQDLPLVRALEYAPVFVLLILAAARGARFGDSRELR